MSLSKCTNYLENRNWLKNTSGLMDTQELSSPEVSVQTTQAKKKRNNKKNPNPRFFTRLIQCLDNKEYTWMLRYVPGSCGKEFEVTFTDRKNKKVWKKEDIALFVELDKYIENVFKRKRSAQKYEEAVKIRFKSNMCKCVDKFIEKMGEKKVGKCKTVKRYKILWRPGPTATDGESNDNIGSDKKPKRKSYRKGKKMEMYRNEPMDSTLENLVNLTLDEDMKIDENENMDSKITLENVPNENSDFYFDEPYLKIGNNTLGKVTFADVSNQDVQIINTFPGNLDDYTIASGQKQIHTCFRNLNAYTKPEYETEINDEISQGNHFLENKFEKDVLKSNPFLCSVPKDSLKIFNSLEDQNSLEDWLGCFQPLNGMEWNGIEQSIARSFGNWK